MSTANHRRGQLRRKLQAASKQQEKFDRETARLIRLIKANRLK